MLRAKGHTVQTVRHFGTSASRRSKKHVRMNDRRRSQNPSNIFSGPRRKTARNAQNPEVYLKAKKGFAL